MTNQELKCCWVCCLICHLHPFMLFMFSIIASQQHTCAECPWHWHISAVCQAKWHAALYDDVIKWKHFPRYWPFWAGNSPITGEFPSQRPVTRRFDVFLDLRLNKRLSKQSWGWWFETPPCPLWRHCNEFDTNRKSLINHHCELHHNDKKVWVISQYMYIA